MARAVPVPGPGLRRDGGHVRLRAIAGRAGRDDEEIAGLIAPALDAIVTALIVSEVAHLDETGFRVAGKLAWAHSASSGRYVLVTVHSKRGTQGMDAAGVLPSFAGIACHDAWKPYDSYDGVAAHALCNAHLLRELIAVTETGTGMTPPIRKSWKSTAAGSATQRKRGLS